MEKVKRERETRESSEGVERVEVRESIDQVSKRCDGEVTRERLARETVVRSVDCC